MKRAIKYHKIFDNFTKTVELLPTPIYWLDIDATLAGANRHFYKLLGINESYVGTNGYDVYPYEVAHHIVEHDKKVMRTGISSLQEETTKDIVDGRTRVYQAFKEPLKDENGKVVGLVGSLIDITDKKQAEQLKIENEKHKAHAKAQEIFQKDVNQVVHDIRSPLASLEMLTTYCNTIPEKERDSFRGIATTISDIANNFLNKYTGNSSSKNTPATNDKDKPRPIIISLLLQQILSEKRFEYQASPVELILSIDSTDYFSCLQSQPLSLKRALSNLINNASEALSSSDGRIVLELKVSQTHINIRVIDNGKGMPESVKKKILEGLSVTNDKEGGHGIGMGQVLETAKKNNAELTIDSIMGSGTTMQLSFKRTNPPSWLASDIQLYKDNLLVILDDDDSIHEAWDTRFSPMQQNHPSMEIKHFRKGDEALKFIKQQSAEARKRLFLLSDYELLNQKLQGLDVVRESQPCKAVLVTSHYNDVKLQKAVEELGIVMLPKELAPKVQIHLNNISVKNSESAKKIEAKDLKSVDLVLVEDNLLFAKQCIESLFAGKTIDHYLNPQSLLKNLHQYTKETPFIVLFL